MAPSLAGNAAQKANRTLPQIDKLLAEAAAAADAADDAREGADQQGATPRALARRAEQRATACSGAGPAGGRGSGPPRRAAGKGGKPGTPPPRPGGHRRAGRRPGDEPRANRAGTELRANTTDPDVRVMRDPKGYVTLDDGQLVVTCQQVIVGVMLAQHPVDFTLLHPLLDTCPPAADPGRDRTAAAGPFAPTPATSARTPSPRPTPAGCGCWHRSPRTQAGTAPRTPQRTLHLDKLPATAAARRRMQHPRGRDDYKMRARTVEPVIGQLIKTCQKLSHDVPARPHRLRKRTDCSPPPRTTCASCTGVARRDHHPTGPFPGSPGSGSPRTAASPVSALGQDPQPGPHAALRNG